MFVDELARLGADVRTDGHHAVVRGGERLSGAPVRATDIRAGAGLVHRRAGRRRRDRRCASRTTSTAATRTSSTTCVRSAPTSSAACRTSATPATLTGAAAAPGRAPRRRGTPSRRGPSSVSARVARDPGGLQASGAAARPRRSVRGAATGPAGRTRPGARCAAGRGTSELPACERPAQQQHQQRDEHQRQGHDHQLGTAAHGTDSAPPRQGRSRGAALRCPDAS